MCANAALDKINMQSGFFFSSSSVCLFSPVAQFSELYFMADWIAWEPQREQALCLGLAGKMCTGVNIPCHFSKGFGACLVRKKLSAWVANPPGRGCITRQESSRSVLAQGRNSASLPLQWASQQKLVWLALQRLSSVPLRTKASHS